MTHEDADLHEERASVASNDLVTDPNREDLQSDPRTARFHTWNIRLLVFAASYWPAFVLLIYSAHLSSPSNRPVVLVIAAFILTISLTSYCLFVAVVHFDLLPGSLSKGEAAPLQSAKYLYITWPFAFWCCLVLSWSDFYLYAIFFPVFMAITLILLGFERVKAGRRISSCPMLRRVTVVLAGAVTIILGAIIAYICLFFTHNTAVDLSIFISKIWIYAIPIEALINAIISTRLVPKSPVPSQAVTLDRPKEPAIGVFLMSAGVIFLILGLLEILMVIPLSGDEEAVNAYLSALPTLGQFVIAIILSFAPGGTPILVLAMPGAIAFFGGRLLVRQGRRRFIVPHVVGAPDWPKSYILYLRPFSADIAIPPHRVSFLRILFSSAVLGLADRWYRSWFLLPLGPATRFEELLTYGFRKVAPLITVGDPKEPFPQIGAWRFYCASEQATDADTEAVWKKEVESAIKRATLVIIHVATTESIKWELRKVVELCNPRDIVLCVNLPARHSGLANFLGKSYGRELAHTWDLFRESCASIFPCELPEAPRNFRFLRFDHDWRPQPVPVPKRKLAWFLRGSNPKFNRKTIDNTLSWLTWLIVPEPTADRILRSLGIISTYVVAVMISFLLLDMVLKA